MPIDGANHARCGVGSPGLSRIFRELLSRDQEDGRATRQPQGVGSETYLNGTSQGPTPEDARLPARRSSSSERRTAISVVAAGDSGNIRDMSLKVFLGKLLDVLQPS